MWRVPRSPSLNNPLQQHHRQPHLLRQHRQLLLNHPKQLLPQRSLLRRPRPLETAIVPTTTRITTSMSGFAAASRATGDMGLEIRPLGTRTHTTATDMGLEIHPLGTRTHTTATDMGIGAGPVRPIWGLPFTAVDGPRQIVNGRLCRLRRKPLPPLQSALWSLLPRLAGHLFADARWRRSHIGRWTRATSRSSATPQPQ